MRNISSRFTKEYISSLRTNEGLWQMSIIDLQHSLRDTRLELAEVLEWVSRRSKSKL